MRILHVAESVLGGCGTYLNEIVPLQLNDLGCDNIRLVVPYQHLSHLAAVDGSAMLPFQRKSRAIGIFHLTVSTIQAISHLRPEIVHAHSSIAGFVVRVCCALRKNPPIVIYCSHGWAFEFSRSKLLRNIAAKCERFLARFCNRIVAISDADREEGESAGISAKKIVVFHNGISASLPSLEAACWPQPGRKVLFVGRLDFQKGLDVLLSALSGLDDSFALRIVGDTVVSKKSMVLEQIPRAEHLGWLNQTDVFRQMNACDVVVVPSRWEGFGMVAIEAMRAGKPVIASAVGGLKEIVVDGVTGRLVRSEDPEALKAALQMDTVEQLRSMGNAGRTRFLRDFTSDRLHQDLLSLYASEIALRSKGAGPLFTIEGGQVN